MFIISNFSIIFICLDFTLSESATENNFLFCLEILPVLEGIFNTYDRSQAVILNRAAITDYSGSSLNSVKHEFDNVRRGLWSGVGNQSRLYHLPPGY